LIYHGFSPLNRIPSIDTCQVAKSKLFLFNNRLNTLAKFLKTETKLENGGWSLWEDVLKRKPKAQKLMAKYCMQDVEVLEQVFLKLRPLIGNLPNYNLFYGKDSKVCPNCGSHRITKDGTRMTRTGLRQRYICNNCGTKSTTDLRDKLPRTQR